MTWKDIGGLEEVKTELQELVQVRDGRVEGGREGEVRGRSGRECGVRGWECTELLWMEKCLRKRKGVKKRLNDIR